MQRCGLCSLLSRLLRRAMCVGSRRGSGESYYQELETTKFNFVNFCHKKVIKVRRSYVNGPPPPCKPASHQISKGQMFMTFCTKLSI
ncbi:COesterase domain-containing protein [Sergentomyia squamirostris]